MAIPRGTTPTYVLTVSDTSVDWTEAEHVYATFRQGKNNVLTKEDTDMDVEARSLSVYFSQEDTLRFKPNKPLEVQVNWTLTGGQRAATQIVEIMLSDNLIGEVLE